MKLKLLGLYPIIVIMAIIAISWPAISAATITWHPPTPESGGTHPPYADLDFKYNALNATAAGDFNSSVLQVYTDAGALWAQIPATLLEGGGADSNYTATLELPPGNFTVRARVIGPGADTSYSSNKTFLISPDAAGFLQITFIDPTPLHNTAHNPLELMGVVAIIERATANLTAATLIIESESGTILVAYPMTVANGSGGDTHLVAYNADLSSYAGNRVYISINATDTGNNTGQSLKRGIDLVSVGYDLSGVFHQFLGAFGTGRTVKIFGASVVVMLLAINLISAGAGLPTTGIISIVAAIGLSIYAWIPAWITVLISIMLAAILTALLLALAQET